MTNQWDLVPWAIGGGAKHSVNTGRFLAYAAFNGDEGVVGSLDLEVRAQNVPNGSVRVLPGACSILNRGLNVVAEAYAARLPIQDTVNVSPTGSGAGRSDLVVAVIMNPFQDGEPWPDPSPESVAAGTAEFVKTMVIPNVPSGTKTVKELGLGYSAIALARIDIPVSTATITQGMIVDLRQMNSVRQAQVRRSRVVLTNQALSSNVLVKFPTEAEFTVEVPEWATHVTLDAQIGGVGVPPADSAFNLLVTIHETGLTYGTKFGFATFAQFPILDTRMVAPVNSDPLAIPPEWRGTTKYVNMWGQLVTGHAGIVRADQTWSNTSVVVTWQQRPESSA